MLGHLAGVIIHFVQLILIHVFEYGVSSTYALTLPVIQLDMRYLTSLFWIQHTLTYFASFLTVIVINFQTKLRYMYLWTEQHIHIC